MSTIDIRKIKNLLPEDPVRMRLYTRLEEIGRASCRERV